MSERERSPVRMLERQHYHLRTKHGLSPAHIAVMTDDELVRLGSFVGKVTLAQKNELPVPPDVLAAQLRADVDVALAKDDAALDEMFRGFEAQRKREAAENATKQADRQVIREKTLPLAVALVTRYLQVSTATQSSAATAATWARAISEYFADYLTTGADNRDRLR